MHLDTLVHQSVTETELRPTWSIQWRTP